MDGNASVVFFGWELWMLYLLIFRIKIVVNDIGINSRFYPRHYAKPCRWLRKLFSIKQRMVPNFILFEYYLCLFFVLLYPLKWLALYLAYCLEAGHRIVAFIEIVPTLLHFLNTCCYLIVYSIYKKYR